MNYKIKLNSVNCFIFDVDGVLTDGSILINGTDYQRKINVKDSYAIQLASKLGYRIFLITGGESEFIKKTYLKLGVTEVYLESSDKVKVFELANKKYDLDVNRVVYVGDDIPDLQLMQRVGVPVAPQDACNEIKSIACYVSPLNGGNGCVRDIIEQTLRVQGKWLIDEAFTW